MKDFYKYLQVNQDYGYEELVVHNAGHTHIESHAVYPPGKHPKQHMFSYSRGRVIDEYQLIYLTEGQGKLQTQSGGKYEISAGKGFFIFPGEWHRYKPDEETGWTENWVGFKGSNSFLKSADQLVSRRNPVFSIGLDDRLIRQFNNIFEVVKSDFIGAEFVLSGGVNFLIGHILTQLKRQALQITSQTDEIIMAAKSLLERDFDKRVSLENIASELNISYVWFRTYFKKHTGFSPYDYLLNIRINHARLLLQNSGLSVKEISQSSGFESQQQFSKTFKKKTGLTPLQFRKQ
ncbi:MAG: AraC family transcriptional regulator [Bacteroidetes bacterium]|nr:AraC family transcriptional regulator [Bacteroidota bacterium]